MNAVPTAAELLPTGRVSRLLPAQWRLLQRRLDELDVGIEDVTVRLYSALMSPRERVTKGLGSRAAGIAAVFKLIESTQHRWCAVNSADRRALIGAGAKFETGILVDRPGESASGDAHAA